MLAGSNTNGCSGRISDRVASIRDWDVQPLASNRPVASIAAACHREANFEKGMSGPRWCKELSANIQPNLHLQAGWANGVQATICIPWGTQLVTRASIWFPSPSLYRNASSEGILGYFVCCWLGWGDPSGVTRHVRCLRYSGPRHTPPPSRGIIWVRWLRSQLALFLSPRENTAGHLQWAGIDIFLTQFLCQAICTQRTPKGPK